MLRNSLICLLFIFIAGCGDGDLGTQVTSPPVNVEDRIKKIQDDPNLPQPAKDAQIAAIQAQAKNGAAQSEAIQKSKK